MHAWNKDDDEERLDDDFLEFGANEYVHGTFTLFFSIYSELQKLCVFKKLQSLSVESVNECRMMAANWRPNQNLVDIVYL